MKALAWLPLAALGLSACNKPEAAPVSDTDKNEVSAAPKIEANAEASDPHAGLSNYPVDRVAELLDKKEAVPVDANSSDTRAKYGTLPGAILLTSSEKFELSELPADKSKPLVFYCGGEKCTAAPKAAKRAEAAGYGNVHVMREGIRGWVKAGKSVESQS